MAGEPLTRAAFALVVYGAVGGVLVRWGRVEAAGAVARLRFDPGDAFLLGFLTVFGGGFASVVHVGGLAGYPAGVVGAGLYLAVVAVGGVVAALGLGTALAGDDLRRAWLVGSVASAALLGLPGVGVLVVGAMTVAGTGAFVRWAFDGDPDARRTSVPAAGTSERRTP